jgi:hypothetical protein
MNSDLVPTIARRPRTSLRYARRVAPFALIIAMACGCLGFLVTSPEGLFNRYSDLLAFHLGTQTILHDSWQAGHGIPVWRSDTFSGSPAFANPQSMYTHPFHILFLLVRPERVVGLVIWLQLLLGALGGYYAGTVLRLSTPGRLLVAIALLFSFKTILAVYAGWLTLIPGMAAMPLLFAAAAVALERPSLRSALLFGGAGALVLHSGHPQFPYYASLFVAVWAAVTLGRHMLTGHRWKAVEIAGTLTLGGVMAAGLSAYVIAPIAYNAALVTRWSSSYEIFLGDHPLVPSGLLTIFNPELFGTPLDGSFAGAWETVVYFGAMTSLLAVAGTAKGQHRPYVGALVAGVVISLALGVYTPLTHVAYTFVPGFHLFRLPARVLFVTAFFVCCLAGVGLDIVISSARTVQSRRLAAAVIIGLVALEGSFWARRYLRVPEAAPYVARPAYVRLLASADPATRVASLSRSTPSYGAAAPLGLQLIAGYDPFNLDHYQRFIDLLQYDRVVDSEPVGAYRQPNWTDVRQVVRFDMLAALNVQYLVAPTPVTVPAGDYSLIGSFDDQPQFRFYEGVSTGPVFVYRNERPLGRAFFVSDVVTVADQKAAVAAVLKTDLRTTAVIAGPLSNVSSGASATDRVDVLRTAPGHLDLATRSAGTRFLVISEVWLPGWRARVDGRPADLSRADIALQGLWLVPGEHRVELAYWPPGLTGGLIMTALTACGVVALMILVRVRSRPA